MEAENVVDALCHMKSRKIVGLSDLEAEALKLWKWDIAAWLGDFVIFSSLTKRF